jgi:hypothetical protein
MNPLLVAAAADKANAAKERIKKANEKEELKLAEKRANRSPNAGFAKTLVEEIPSWAKGILVIAAVGVVGYVVYRVAKGGLKSLKDAREKGQLKNDEKDLLNKGVKYSYLTSQYNSFADKIYSALKGATEDEDAIKTVMSNMKNDLDVLALIAAYGSRDASYWAWETANYDLVTALNAYLSDSEMELYVNTPLRINNVKYQF